MSEPRVVQKIASWTIERVVPYERNARLHSQADVAKLANFIERHGFNKPIEVDEAGVILCGHRRLAAARALGMTHVPVIQHKHLDEAMKREYRLADNRLTLEGEWDEDLLASEMAAILEAGGDAAFTGFTDEELAALDPDGGEVAEEPELPATPATPVSRPGDLWILGPHRVLCGDATSLRDLRVLTEGREVDAAWTDPPYNVAYEGTAGVIANDALSDAAFAALLDRAFAGIFATLRAGGPIYVAHSDTGGGAFRRAFVSAGFHLSSCLIWRKNALVLSRGDYHWQHEPILYGWKPGASHRWFGARDKTTIHELGDSSFQQVGEREWQIVLGETTLIVRGEALTVEPVRGSVFYENKPATSAEHPTMKPVPLIRRQLANSARRGDAVIDPFGGSGSTLMACEGLGMRARLLELDPRFVDVIVRRWEQATGGGAALEGGESFAAVGVERLGAAAACAQAP